MAKILYIVFLCGVVLQSCSDKKKYLNAEMWNWDDFQKEVPLSGEDMYFNDQLQKPVRILIDSHMLYLVNQHTENLLQLIDLRTQQTIGEYIPFGSGPKEMTGIKSLQKKDTVLYLYDPMKRSLELYSSNQFNHLGSIKSNYFFESYSLLADTTIVALIVDATTKRLSFLKNNHLLKTIGEFPETNSVEEMSGLEKINGYAAYITCNEDKNRIVVVHKQTDLIDIYNLEGTLLRRLHGPDHFFPEIKTRNMGELQSYVAQKGISRDAYFNPVSTNDAFYVQYSGRVVENNGSDYLHSWLFAFDWDGNPLVKYKLNQPQFNFTFDSATNTIYGLSDSPEFHVIRFQLP